MLLNLQRNPTEPAHAQIQRCLRGKIASGRLRPGARLPTNLELARLWRVSCRDVQRALAGLTTAGLIARAPRRGTYVRTPPAAIAVLFGPGLSNEAAHFYRAIHRSLLETVSPRQWDLRVYDQISGLSAAQEPLAQALRDHSFQGLIKIAPHSNWPRELRDSRLPCACWNPSLASSDVAFDRRHFARETATYLARQGRRRIAYFRSAWHLAAKIRNADLEELTATMRAHRLPPPQVTPLALRNPSPQSEREIHIEVLNFIRAWRDNPPDALLVNDDIVMRAVALALLKANAIVRRRLLIVCMTCEEIDLHYGLPVARYAFSTRELARQLRAVLEKRLDGETFPFQPVLLRGQIQEPRP